MMNLQEVAGFASICYEDKWKKKKEELEPTSVLHTRSPSPPTSASTLSSSAGAAAPPPAAASELKPVPSELDRVGFEDWESMMSGSAASLAQEQSLLRWISGDFDGNAGFEQIGVSGMVSGAGDPNSAFPGSGFCSLPPGLMYQQFESPDEKPQLHQPQRRRRHNAGGEEAPISDPGQEFMLRNLHHQNQHLGFAPATRPGEEMAHQQALLDQLYHAGELVGTGNFPHAQAILARLNHQLSPAGNALLRAAFYFKEALQLLIAPQPRAPAQFDFIFKMGAYKAFSEVSPITRFVNFTSNQALLEALNDSNGIHIFDFDIGFGDQWASFMQELPIASSLKITAFASSSTHHPIELELMHKNLTQFAIDTGLNFELELINFDSFNQFSYPLPNKAIPIAVNFPIWAFSDQPPALPSILSFVKNLSPKIVVSLDKGGDRSDLPFPQHLLHTLQSYVHLFESLDAVNAAPGNVDKIERFLLQPRIESTVLGCFFSNEKVPFWRTLFASAGFSPVPFSSFTRAQAECVARRAPVRGFHVEKCQVSLTLCWQSRELVSASAWRLC